MNSQTVSVLNFQKQLQIPVYEVKNDKSSKFDSDEEIKRINNFIKNLNLYVDQYITWPASLKELKKKLKKVKSAAALEKADDSKKSFLLALQKIYQYYVSYEPTLAEKQKNDSKTHPQVELCPTVYTQERIPELSLDIWNEIFKKMELKNWQSVGALSLVCKRVNQIIQTPKVLKSILEREPNVFSSIVNDHTSRKILQQAEFSPTQLKQIQVNLTDHSLRNIAEHGENLEKICFQGSEFGTAEWISFLNLCPNLHTIEFENWQYANFDDYLIILGRHAPNIKHLKIVNCEISDQSLLALTCLPLELRSFECIHTLKPGVLSDQTFALFLQHVKNLQTIKMIGCPRISQLPFLFYFAKKHSDHSLPFGHYLTHFTFSHCGSMNEELLDELVQCPNLETLELSCHKNLLKKETPRAEADFENSLLDIPKRCKKIKKLKLIDSPLSSESLKDLIENFHQLEYLELISSKPLTHSFFKQLADRNLLSFVYQPSVSSHLRSKEFGFLQECKSLQRLCLVNCQIDSFAFNSYLKSAPQLETLQLIKCKELDVSFIHTLSQSSPYLKVLEIDSSFDKKSIQINDQNIEMLAKNCRLLTHLILNTPATNAPWQFSQLSLRSLARYTPHLTHLTLSHLNLNTPKSSFLDSPLNVLNDFTKSCIKIMHLGLPYGQFSVQHFHKVIQAYQQQLRFLDISNITTLESKDYDIIIHCFKLENLIFNQNSIDPLQIQNLKKTLKFLNF